MISKFLTNRIFDTIQEFSIQKYSQPLGVGSFGTVRLGVHKYTNKSYAIKIISIDKNFKENQLCLLQRQIQTHYNLNHPHIVKLWDVIQQKDKIYMIMQFAHKGNLFNYQSNFQCFTQIEAFRIFMQITDALDYLHKNNVFHRDIKPENILLDHELNTKLCDFGQAAPDILRKRSTFCGTYEYMAPEMINEQQYDFRIDIWALGVLLFQMTHAAAPFPAQNLQEMKKKISTGSYEIKVGISAEVKSLIMSILQFDPKNRPTIQQIKGHVWIEKMKRSIQQKSSQNLFDKKKPKNVHGSLDCMPSNKHTNKFSSLPLQDFSNKRQQRIVPSQVKKKLQKKKCKTLQEQSLQKITKPTKNMLTLYNQKQNEDGTQVYLDQLMKVKDRLKMQNKITLLRKDSLQKSSKLNLNRINNYFVQTHNTDFKNFKSEDKIDRNGLISTNRNLHISDVKKKKRRLQ